jgi:purine-binding chemotaxis protein CheW
MSDDTTGGPASSPHLLVRSGEYLCALPLSSVRRVVRALTVRPLPGSSEELKGLSEFAGEPLPVVDLAKLVGAPPSANPEYPVTVVAWAGPPDGRELIGLAADAALEVVELPARSVVAGEGGVIFGETSVGDEAVRVLDLEALGGEP